MAEFQTRQRTDLEKKVNRRTLVFMNAEVEEEFVNSRKESLIQAVRNAHKAFQAAPVVLALNLANEFMNRDPEKAKECPRAVEFILGATCVIQLIIILVLLAWTPRCLARVSPRACELMVVVESYVFMFLVSSTHTYTAAALVAVDPYLCYWQKDGTGPNFEDTKIVLTWAIMQAAIHLFFPIRWIVLLPFEVACVATYASLAVAPAYRSAVSIVSTWMMCAVLVIVAAMGKRRLEWHERIAMLMYISEKTLRFETEFKLGQMLESGERVVLPESEASTSEITPSMKSVPMSHYIFEAPAGVDVHLRLSAIKKFGEQESWLISPHSLKCFPEILLGRGGYGVVVFGCYAGAAAAVKIPVARGEMTVSDLAHEIRVIRRMRHPNIVGFLGVCVVPEEQLFMLVEEYVSGKSMKAVLTSDEVVSHAMRGSILLDICRALLYLHGLEPAVAHGDLKPANILLQRSYGASFQAKLIDFGLSRRASPQSKPMGGSCRYMSPEIVLQFASKAAYVSIDSGSNSSDSSKFCCSDMFSYGRVIFFAATGVEPLVGMSFSDILAATQGGQPELEWPELMTSWQVECRALSEKCLCTAPEARATSMDVFALILQWPETYRSHLHQEITTDTAPSLVSDGSATPKDPIAAFQDAKLRYLGKQTCAGAEKASLEARNAIISHFKLSI